MTREAIKSLPPGPWHYETTAPPDKHDGNGHVYVVDANGRKIAAVWGPPETKIATATMMIKARAFLLSKEGSA